MLAFEHFPLLPGFLDPILQPPIDLQRPESWRGARRDCDNANFVKQAALDPDGFNFAGIH